MAMCLFVCATFLYIAWPMCIFAYVHLCAFFFINPPVSWASIYVGGGDVALLDWRGSMATNPKVNLGSSEGFHLQRFPRLWIFL